MKNEVKTRLPRRIYLSTFPFTLKLSKFWKPQNNNINYLYAVKTPSLQQVQWLQYRSSNTGLPFLALQIKTMTPSQKNSTNFMFLLERWYVFFLSLVNSCSYCKRSSLIYTVIRHVRSKYVFRFVWPLISRDIPWHFRILFKLCDLLNHCTSLQPLFNVFQDFQIFSLELKSFKVTQVIEFQ